MIRGATSIKQLILPFFQSTQLNFENFYIGDNNLELVKSLQEWLSSDSPKVFYLWGDSGTGKTHLLNASLNCCLGPAIYLPLREFVAIEPRVFDNLENIDTVAVDDIDTISGDSQLETKLFDLFNKVILSEGKLIVAGRQHPNKQRFKLNDLVSRLCSGLLYKVSLLSDEERKKALNFLLLNRGMTIESKYIEYIMRHYKRDMKNLILIIDKIDKVSLSERRPVSLNLIKQITTDLKIY